MPLLGLSFVGLRLFRPVGSIRLRGRAIACGNTPGFLGLWLFRPVGSIRLRGRAIASGNSTAIALCAQRLAYANRYRHTRAYF